MTTSISVEGLTKRFRDVVAVDDVSFAVEEGAAFAFLGTNGAGKSTTIACLTTVLRPDAGRLTVDGHDVVADGDAVRRAIGVVFQDSLLDDSLTVRENLALRGTPYLGDGAAIRTRITQLAELVQLDEILDRRYGKLSGGQRRRVDIARALIHEPPLLFLDEPTTGLDPQSRAHLWEEIRKLRTQGTTVFLTTHYLDEADALCDRLCIIDDGMIVAEGTPDVLKRQVAGDVVTLGLDSLNGALLQAQALLSKQSFVREMQVDKDQLRLYVERGEQALPLILRVLDGAGLGLQTIALARPSLDDVFLRQTGRSLREEAA